MSGLANKLAKPVVEIIDHIASKVPKALGHGHHRIAAHVHSAADTFEKAEGDLAGKAGHTHHHTPNHHHDPADVEGTGAAAAAKAKPGEKAAADADRQAGSTARQGAEDPEKTGKPGEGRCKGGDPIDLVSGEVLITENDVRLPAVLSLVLDRTYVSSYRAGRLFGPSWASTLDERLEADEQGLVLATADGMLLVYPVPRPGEPVLPTHGPRLPLLWDGSPQSEIRVSDPAGGQTRHFSPPVEPSGTAPFVLQLTAVTDRNGNRITIERLPDGTPTAVRHSCGYAVAVDCAQGRVTGLRLLQGGSEAPAEGAEAAERPVPSHRLRRFTYDTRGNLTGVVDGTGLAKRYAYDERGRVVQWTDRVGSWYRFTYDDADRCVSGTGADGVLDCTIAYDEAARTTAYTDSLGNTTVHRHNDRLQRVAVTDPLGATQHAEWDAFGRLLASVDALGARTRFAYDARGRLTGAVRPDGGTYQVRYHADLPRPLSLTDAGGNTWSYAYDARGNRTEAVEPTGARTRYAYDDRGRLTSFTDALGNTTTVRTDTAGLPVSLTDPLGSTTTVERDGWGRVVAVTDPLGHVTRMGWTTEGRPDWREFADGSREEWEWDAEGGLLGHTDTAGNTSHHTTTHFAREASSTEPDGSGLHFAYDTELRLTEVTNAEGLTWNYAYDAAGRLVREADFDGRARSYAYDAAGRLATVATEDGPAVAFERDVLGQVVTQRFGPGPGEWTAYRYSPGGHLVAAENQDAAVTRDVDPVGRVLAETVNGATTAYTYDLTGNVLSRRLPSGVESTWSYDGAGQPMGLSIAGQNLAFGHDAAGRETSRTFGDRVRLHQTWDEVDQLTAQALGPAVPDASATPAGVTLLRTYGYDAGGMVAAISEPAGGTRHFDVDTVGRVTSVRAEGWSAAYTYDIAGNLTGAVTDDPATPAELRDAPKEFGGTVVRRSGRTDYAHDDRGRLVRRTVRLLDGRRRVQTFVWDEADRLRETVTPGGDRWRYTYDGLGRRIAKSRVDADGTVVEEVRFFWDGVRVAESTAAGPGDDPGAGAVWEYAPQSSEPVVQVTRTGGLVRVHAVVADAAGTPRELVSADGEVAWRSTGDLWGGPRAGGRAEVDCPLRFPGQYADPETGLNYNVHRYYDPETARYTSPDPLGLAPAPNPVAYADNPLTDSDPLGLAKRPHRSDATLLAHAKLIHDAVKVGKKPESAKYAHSKMTVSTFADAHGNLYYTVNNNKTSKAQRKLAESLGYERINGKYYTSPMETDAEQIMLNAMDAGRIPDAGRLATSRPACDDIRPSGVPGQNCRDRIAHYPNVTLIE
ncbi:MAG: DUF6531 domain-containing protein [Actinomycetia bacterium]|nr:DUF6531 domain-containing protein [Actinomycetes bacterium]